MKDRGAKAIIINISIPGDLLKRVDEIAKRDYASRSNIIRQALVDFMRGPRKRTIETERRRREQYLDPPDPLDDPEGFYFED